MIGIRGTAIAKYFRINLRTSCFGMLQFFQNHHTGALSHDKAISILVKRNGTSCRILAGGKGCQCCETGYPDLCYAGFRTTRYHHICIAVLNGSEGFSDGIGTCGTGSNHVDALSFQVEHDAHIAGCHIGNHQRHQQRGHLGRSSVHKSGVFSLHSLQGTYPVADGTSHSVGILLFHVQLCILNGFFCRSHRILTESFHSSCGLLIHVLFRFKIFYLGCKLCLVVCCIKICDWAKTDFALFDAFPKGGYIITDGGDGTQSGYNYSFLHIASDLCLVVPNRAYSQRLTRSHSIKNVADTNSQKTLVSADVLKRSAADYMSA